MSKYWRKGMRKVNCLASFNYYLFEIGFPKELSCCTRNKFFVWPLLKLVLLCHFAPVVKIPLKNVNERSMTWYMSCGPFFLLLRWRHGGHRIRHWFCLRYVWLTILMLLLKSEMRFEHSPDLESWPSRPIFFVLTGTEIRSIKRHLKSNWLLNCFLH